MKAFISYAHGSKHHLATFLKWLSQLHSDSLLEGWCDAQLIAGEEWDAVIKKNLAQADVAFFLVTQDYIHSDYIARIEISEAIKDASVRKKIVIPILCEVSTFEDSPLAKFQAIPKGTPIENWDSPNQAWLEVYKSIRTMLKSEAGKEKARLKVREKEGKSGAAQLATARATVFIEPPEIQFSPAAIEDCKAGSIEVSAIEEYVKQETQRHPLMFIKHFESTPIPFRNSVIILSWDGCVIRVGRLLGRRALLPSDDEPWITGCT